MADLDDFFAKRDKSKKSKKKYDTSDDVAKVLEQKTKEKKKLETGKSNYLPEGGRQSPGPGLPINDDDEWLEAEEKKPDFSNLKIQELVLDSDDDEEPGQEGQEDADGANEGPWNKKSSKNKEGENNKEESEEKTEDNANAEEGKSEENATAESSQEPEKESGEKKYVPPSKRKTEEQSAAPKAAYVPPYLRGSAGSGATLAPMPKKKGAPSLDDESFPSLS